MKHLFRTTAIAFALGGIALGAHAQQGEKGHMSAGNQTGSGMQASYCEEPWAQVDGNSDGFVSREEAGSAMENRFGEIDADGNGEITKTEWVDCLSSMRGRTAAEADRNEQNFADADSDQDGRLGRDEFREGAQQAFEGTRSDGADENAFVVLRRYVFLTPEEDQSTLENMSADEAAGRSAMTFSALDQNDDDIVDTKEWSERTPRVAQDEEWANARFDEMDSDATGSISREEYQTARRQMLDGMSTGSTTNDGSGEHSASAKGDASSASDQSQGIPVYVYRFWAM